MKVLLVNKFWYSKGGSERYTFALKGLLEARGHEVIPFAMEDERNEPTPWAEHFVSHVDFWDAEDAVPNQTNVLQKLSRVTWSREAARKLDALLTETKLDVVHLQNFAHQISPSILPVLARHGVPVVWTLHDYKVLCPNYRMYTQGSPCERCKGHSYVNAIRHRCMGSLGASAAVALEMYLHHTILNVYGKHLSAVIAPSAFLATKLGEWGWSGRVEVVPNFITSSGLRGGDAEGGSPTARNRMSTVGVRSGRTREQSAPLVLFVGRLQEEKGVEDFVEASKRLPDVPFAVVGDGPLLASMRARSLANVRWYGALTPTETRQQIASAAMVVIPSRWYENAPYVALEAMAAGVPVIASRIGGLPELVRDGVNGMLVPPRDPETLAKTVDFLYRDLAKRKQFGASARDIATEDYGPDRHYERLIAIYESLTRNA